jgi:hypothetical protein
MSFIGVGGQDWVELDLDLFDRQRLSRLRSVLVEDKARIVAAIGVEYEVEFDEVGNAFLVVDGSRRFQADITNADRLMLSGILDPDGPL